MSSIPSSRKGMESAPFFLVVSAIIIVMTLSILFPAISNWMIKMNDAAAMRETQKLRDAINEISAMGDIGSVQKLIINLPPGYFIEVKETELYMYRKTMDESGLTLKDLLTLKIDNKAKTTINPDSDDPNQVFGHMTIELIYGNAARCVKPFQICVG
jgi:hypothetical protein